MIQMDTEKTRRITITDSLLGTTEINFKQVCEPTDRKAISSLVLDTVMKYIRENDVTLIDIKNTDGTMVDNHVTDHKVTIPKNVLRQLYEENAQLKQIRDAFTTQIKAFKTPLFDAFCADNINTNKLVYVCEACQFEAKSPKALAAHRKGKECVSKRAHRTERDGERITEATECTPSSPESIGDEPQNNMNDETNANQVEAPIPG